MTYRAAVYGFRNQGLSEMISLVLLSIESSHALQPSRSPIKVTNIEIIKTSYPYLDAIVVQIELE